MTLQSLTYNSKEFAKVNNLIDFYRTPLPEIPKVRSIYDAIKVLFKVSNNALDLKTTVDDRIYQFIIYESPVKKKIIGIFIYIPKEKRLDMWEDSNQNLPIIQWKDKKPVFKNYPEILNRVDLHKLYNKIVNLT